LILFLGDGMGLATITAGRIRKGQMKNKSGEEEITYMESLENVALSKVGGFVSFNLKYSYFFSKTYNIDAQTAESAGTATAYLCGVKTGVSIIGLNGLANQSQCISTFTTKADSILKWAHKAGKMVGIVTTTRITHATPAAAYANVPNRRWESYDGRDFSFKEYIEGCSDIASQLLINNSYINVSFFISNERCKRNSFKFSV
jgi:alkaline phosphatase